MFITANKEYLEFFISNPNKNFILQNYKNENPGDFLHFYNPYNLRFCNPGEEDLTHV